MRLGLPSTRMPSIAGKLTCQRLAVQEKRFDRRDPERPCDVPRPVCIFSAQQVTGTERPPRAVGDLRPSARSTATCGSLSSMPTDDVPGLRSGPAGTVIHTLPATIQASPAPRPNEAPEITETGTYVTSDPAAINARRTAGIDPL